jgi:hypothetical protein
VFPLARCNATSSAVLPDASVTSACIPNFISVRTTPCKRPTITCGCIPALLTGTNCLHGITYRCTQATAAQHAKLGGSVVGFSIVFSKVVVLFVEKCTAWRHNNVERNQFRRCVKNCSPCMLACKAACCTANTCYPCGIAKFETASCVSSIHLHSS